MFKIAFSMLKMSFSILKTSLWSTQMTSLCDMLVLIIAKERKKKSIKSELRKSKRAKDHFCKIPICYDDSDMTIPLQSPPGSYQPRSPLTLKVVEIVIPEVGGIDTDILLTIKDDILHEKLLNVNLLIANIEALKDNPTPSSDFVTKSSSTSLNLFLEETNTFDNSLTESLCLTLEENFEDDAHVTLKSAHFTQKTEGPLHTSSVSSDFTTQFLILDNVPQADNEIISMMNVKVRHEEPSNQTPLFLTILVTIIPETSTVSTTTIPLFIHPFTPLPQLSTSTPIEATTSLPVLKEEVKSEIEKYMEFIEKSVKANVIDQKILLDKMQKSQSYRGAKEHEELYDGLVKSYKLDNDLFESYGKEYSLKRGRKDKDKDEDPPAGSDQGLKRRKTSKDVEPSKGPKLKESKLSSSKGTKSQPKSSGKSAQAEESVFEIANTEMPQNQGSDLGNTGEQPNVKDAPKHDWFKKPERPSTPDSDWNIDHLTQNYLVRPAFNLKGTCRSRVELESNIEECYKAVTDRLDWNNPEGKEYPFDLSKPLLLIMDRDRQVVPVDYFINNDLEYLKGGSSSKKYEYGVWVVTKVKVMKWYDYGYLEEIEVQRKDQQLYKFKEGDFPRLHLYDIEDMLLLLVHKKLSNLERDVIFYLGVVLRMSDISNRTPYTAYNNPQGIIYEDKYKRNRMMRTDELYKFSDGTLTSVRSVLHDIASNLRID
ncbi:hypothetical protein Tco_1344652 [Tanacetum coccineum]